MVSERPYINFTEETRWVKTYLAECNLNVTSPDGECSKILVSDPEENKMRAS